MSGKSAFDGGGNYLGEWQGDAPVSGNTTPAFDSGGNYIGEWSGSSGGGGGGGFSADAGASLAGIVIMVLTFSFLGIFKLTINGLNELFEGNYRKAFKYLLLPSLMLISTFSWFIAPSVVTLVYGDDCHRLSYRFTEYDEQSYLLIQGDFDFSKYVTVSINGSEPTDVYLMRSVKEKLHSGTIRLPKVVTSVKIIKVWSFKGNPTHTSHTACNFVYNFPRPTSSGEN